MPTAAEQPCGLRATYEPLALARVNVMSCRLPAGNARCQLMSCSMAACACLKDMM